MAIADAELVVDYQPERNSISFDRHFWSLVGLASAILLIRSIAIISAQSERIDDEYHIQRGIAFLDRRLASSVQLPLNDPPAGEGLTILPLWIFNVWPHDELSGSAIWGQKVSADFILQAIGIWKSLLFIPAIAVAFIWTRLLYGNKSAWLAAIWILADPTIAAHVPLPTPDALAAEAIFIACFAAWRYFRAPDLSRLIGLSILTGITMVMKHTAIIMPAVILAAVIVYQIVIPWKSGTLKRNTFGLLIGNGVLGTGIVVFTIWACCLFDVSKPKAPELPQYGLVQSTWQTNHPLLDQLTQHSLPGGVYISSFLGAQLHAERGHPGYLWGTWSNEGRWYYFPAVALYKIPFGFWILLGMAALSVAVRRISVNELLILIAIVGWASLLMSSRINLGFRHFLPAYLFIILFASRVAGVTQLAWQRTVWTAAAVGALYPLSYWPDLISYTNLPAGKVWFHINDSNIDWGQGLKYARHWIDAHPDRKTTVRDYAWGEARLFNVRQRVGNAPLLLNLGDPPPTEGVLIISAMALARDNTFRALRPIEPTEMLGHCMLVYDLDQLRKPGEPFRWRRTPTTAAPATVP